MSQITAQLNSGTAVRLSNGRHEWKADEPPEIHGTDTGPNPYELLLGSLAACTCITLSLYCRHKNIALESVSATYDYDRIHARDCEECEEPKKGFIDRITSQVHIAGEFDDAQRPVGLLFVGLDHHRVEDRGVGRLRARQPHVGLQLQRRQGE